MRKCTDAKKKPLVKKRDNSWKLTKLELMASKVKRTSSLPS